MSEVKRRVRYQLVHGRMMTRKQAAGELGVPKRQFDNYITNHHCTMEQAYDFFKFHGPFMQERGRPRGPRRPKPEPVPKTPTEIMIDEAVAEVLKIIGA